MITLQIERGVERVSLKDNERFRVTDYSALNSYRLVLSYKTSILSMMRDWLYSLIVVEARRVEIPSLKVRRNNCQSRLSSPPHHELGLVFGCFLSHHELLLPSGLWIDIDYLTSYNGQYNWQSPVHVKAAICAAICLLTEELSARRSLLTSMKALHLSFSRSMITPSTHAT